MLIVFRFGHRVGRDERATTHVCLVARAFGADKAVVSGEQDSKILESVRKVSSAWGGDFEVEYCKEYKKTLREIKKSHKIIHLTMYGEQVQDKIVEIKKHKDICVVVGSQKVPTEIYQIADYNIAVTSQPHSEIAALAVFLDRYHEGKELEKEFGGRLKIKPMERGKCVVSCD